ncbi:MAG: 3-deoxy-D-manno-octulosonate 8-phosphate phosphatase [Acidobacteria bacterium]|nr:3-deoxy-D-manno-octulosonate 8-phosphate phosphatase [Acidobacteriota bacterium]
MPLQLQTPDAVERAKRVEFILMDVDGVMTDGRIYLIPDGSGGCREMKTFDVSDGVAITFAHRVGLRTGILTGRASDSVTWRAKDLGISIVEQGSHNKIESYIKLLDEHELTDAILCYIGDDWQDLPMMRRAALAVAPANACDDVKKVAHIVTEKSGGRGAVREAIEFILKAQNKWDDAVKRYLD